MSIEARSASLWDKLRLLLFVALPGALWGLVAPNRLGVALLCRLDAGRATLRLLADLRRKYGCDHLWVWFPFRRTLLVLDPESADSVLRSEDNAADPLLKKRALSGFVPDALVISSGAEWVERRRFNEALLDTHRPHRHRDAFAEIVFREVERLAPGQAGRLRWTDFQALGERIAHQVILGAGAVEPGLTADLARLVRRSNWLLPRPRGAFSAFYTRIERHLSEPAPAGCLMHDSSRQLTERCATALTRVPAQIGFWFFVLKDAVELHVARTLALIAAHPDVQARASAEVRGAAALNAGTVDGCRYLEACIEEQLRLWTPVPILLRRATRGFSLRDAIEIREGDQLLIHAGFHHRDERVFGAAAERFSPGSATAAAPVLFFSRHRQSCAGESLARFLLKAVLAALLARFRFELDGPAIVPERIDAAYDHFRIELRMAHA